MFVILLNRWFLVYSRLRLHKLQDILEFFLAFKKFYYSVFCNPIKQTLSKKSLYKPVSYRCYGPIFTFVDPGARNSDLRPSKKKIIQETKKLEVKKSK